MIRKNADNERVKRTYFTFLRQSAGRDEKTIRQDHKALLRFEEHTRFANFTTFGQKQAIGFKAHLAKLNLSKATILSTLRALKKFFAWLATQPGYKRAIRPDDIEYLNLPEKDVRAAQAPADKAYPSLAMVERTIAAMPHGTQIELRNRALMALLATTAIRVGALITLKLKHFDVERRLVMQNPREVDTKFGKRIDTFLFPLNDTFEEIVNEWVGYLREELLFGDHDPLFPKTLMGLDVDHCLRPVGLTREHWKGTAQARQIVKAAYDAAGLPAFSPHRFRDMIVSEMYRRKLSVEEFKAWSQNIGHEHIMTTLTNYGRISVQEQGRLVRGG